MWYLTKQKLNMYKTTDWKQPKHIILFLLIYRDIALDLLLLELLDILYKIS